jgi:uncharacterized protein YdhG (YjbR/CyaY superfamily)
MQKPASVDAYIKSFPPGTRAMLTTLRQTIRQAAPDAEECIAYDMPAYKQGGALVYFAGYAKHVGFYPTGTGIKAFEAELSPYTWSKGAVQFPLDEPLPLDLVTRMVRFKVAERAAPKKMAAAPNAAATKKAVTKKAVTKKAATKKAATKKAATKKKAR